MSSATFHCSVVTPERRVLECEATFAALPAHDGEIGILRHRAPLLCRLGVGRLRVEAGSEHHVFFLDGGFAEMVDNRLTILTDEAIRADELDRERAEGELAAAQQMAVLDEESFAARQRAMQRARVMRQLLA